MVRPKLLGALFCVLKLEALIHGNEEQAIA